jgi:serine/threonine-protein kinase RsbW
LENKQFNIEIYSDPNNLITIEEFVNFIAIECGVPEEKMSGLLISVTEAVTNAIIHANKKDLNKKVNIDAFFENNTLTIKVKDQGVGFDPHLIPDPTQPENILKDSGRGLYLMRTFLNELKYEHSPDGTTAILVLKIK